MTPQETVGRYYQAWQTRRGAYGLMILTLQGDRVGAITGFPDTSLFAHFGLPRSLRE